MDYEGGSLIYRNGGEELLRVLLAAFVTPSADTDGKERRTHTERSKAYAPITIQE